MAEKETKIAQRRKERRQLVEKQREEFGGKPDAPFRTRVHVHMGTRGRAAVTRPKRKRGKR